MLANVSDYRPIPRKDVKITIALAQVFSYCSIILMTCRATFCILRQARSIMRPTAQQSPKILGKSDFEILNLINIDLLFSVSY